MPLLYSFIQISATDTAEIWSVASGVIGDLMPVIIIVGGILLVGLIFSIFFRR